VSRRTEAIALLGTLTLPSPLAFGEFHRRKGAPVTLPLRCAARYVSALPIFGTLKNRLANFLMPFHCLISGGVPFAKLIVFSTEDHRLENQRLAFPGMVNYKQDSGNRNVALLIPAHNAVYVKFPSEQPVRRLSLYYLSGHVVK
jgi:hypothetical protein